MREKVISWFAYLWAGLTGVASGLSMNEIGGLISIFATVFTGLLTGFIDIEPSKPCKTIQR
ncbi:hypothetical protein C0W35_15195 [Photobacterium kishitanii]|nr:hypothetical protein C0W35_15195 [Photobacterium kishitanii]